MADADKKVRVLQKGQVRPQAQEADDPAPSQQDQIAQFNAVMPSTKEQEEYDAAFKTSCELAWVEAEFERAAPGSSKWNRLEKQSRRLEGKITPRKKWRAIDDREPIVKGIKEHIQQFGAPDNIHLLAKQLEERGVLNHISEGRRETVVREILHKVFDFRGKRGRRPNKTK